MGTAIVSEAPAHPIASSALCSGMMSMACRAIQPIVGAFEGLLHDAQGGGSLCADFP